MIVWIIWNKLALDDQINIRVVRILKKKLVLIKSDNVTHP